MTRKKPTKTSTPKPHPTLADLDALAAAYAEKEPKATQQSLFGDIAPQSAVGTMRQHKDKRGFRGQFKFWLCASKPDELALGQELNALKSARKYTATIRDALRLFFDLRAGRTGVLAELFPGIVASLHAQQQQPSDQFNALLSEFHALKNQLTVAPAVQLAGASASLLPADVPLFVEVIERADPAKSRRAFAGSMGNLFSDDDDWDD